MKKIFKITILTILTVLMAVGTVGCKAVDDKTAVSIVNMLVEQSYELNVIYFGDGLDKQEAENENDLYVPVAGSSNYTSKVELVRRTKEIFSQSYSASIIKTAFEGEMGAIGSTAVYARYIEFEDYLSVRRDIEGIEVAKYDFTTTEILKNSKRFIIAKIKTTDTDAPQFVEITLINEENGWRIDSATY